MNVCGRSDLLLINAGPITWDNDFSCYSYVGLLQGCKTVETRLFLYLYIYILLQKTRTPELVPEDADSSWSSWSQGTVSPSRGLIYWVKSFLNKVHDFSGDPRVGPFLLLAALISFGSVWFKRSQVAQSSGLDHSSQKSNEPERSNQQTREPDQSNQPKAKVVIGTSSLFLKRSFILTSLEIDLDFSTFVSFCRMQPCESEELAQETILFHLLWPTWTLKMLTKWSFQILIPAKWIQKICRLF